MNLSERDGIRTRSLVEAAAWRVHLTEAGAGSARVEEFEEWLAADTSNEAAWRQVDGPWRLFGEQATSPEIMEARRAALGRAQRDWRRRWRTSDFFQSATARAIAAAVCVVALGALFAWHLKSPVVYRTGFGERRTVTLADGSTLALDTQTEVQVRYSDTGRSLNLVSGQAQFDVTHDVERPFAVTAGGARVIALGTSFNVDMLGSKLFVTLLQGHVVVVPTAVESSMRAGSVGSVPTSSAAASTPELSRSGHVELNAGEQLVISPVDPPKIVDVDADRVTSWESGRLVFKDETLVNVAARMSRYSKHSFHVADTATANLRISGVFKAGDVDGFVTTLMTYFPLTARSDEDGAIELHLRQ